MLKSKLLKASRACGKQSAKKLVAQSILGDCSSSSKSLYHTTTQGVSASKKSNESCARLVQWTTQQRNLTTSMAPKQSSVSTPHDSFAYVGANSHYLEDLETQWRANPSSVSAEWQTYFASLPEVGSTTPTTGAASVESVSASGSNTGANGEIISLIRAFQVFGHHVSKLDPLGVYSADLDSHDIPQLVRFPIVSNC